MSITQIGIATVSDELLAHIATNTKSDLNTGDLQDFPAVAGHDGQFLGVVKPGVDPEEMQWIDLPPSGLIWLNADADLTAVESTGYLVSGGITITLPASPVAEGTIVAISDDKAVLDLDPMTIDGNGYDINGDSTLTVDMKNASFQLIFDNDEWRITQLNHPTNLSSISEESFNPGQSTYTLSRIPPTNASILVMEDGRIMPSDTYVLSGNQLTFSAARTLPIVVRHIGLPPSVQISDVPVGSIGLFPRAAIQPGWLYGAGGTIGRSIYPHLVEYLTGDSTAETAELPDYRKFYMKGWDNRNNQPVPSTLPSDLSDNRYGLWMKTTLPGTSRNMWDSNVSTTTKVDFNEKQVGYVFDVPILPTAIQLWTSVTVGKERFYPGTVTLESSNNGNDWTIEQANVPNNPNGQTIFTPTSGVASRYWRILGIGGADEGNGYYWDVSYMRFVSDINWTPVGNSTTAATSAHSHPVPTMDIVTAELTTGSDTLTTLITPVVTGDTSLAAAEPSNTEIVICIKAFHTQSGELADTEVASLRTEVNRLSTIHSDIFAQDATVTGDWDFQGAITKDGFDVLTSEDGTGKIPWNIVAIPTLAVTDQGYMVDASAGTLDPADGIHKLVITLPDVPVANDFVVVADYNGMCNQDFTILINGNGAPIMGIVDNFAIDVANVQLTFTYIDASQGWRLTNGLGESEAPSAIRGQDEFTGVAGQSQFPALYEPGYVDVFYNGNKLSQTDFRADDPVGLAQQYVYLNDPVSLPSDKVEIVTYNHVPITDGAYAIPYASGISVGSALDSVSNSNGLINGYLQIWQRGTGPWPLHIPNNVDGVTNESYTADRWVAVSRNQQSGSMAESIPYTDLQNLPGDTSRPRTLRLTSSTTDHNGDTCALEQRIEGVESGAGYPLTMTFTYKTNLALSPAGHNVAIELGRWYGQGAPTESEPGVIVESLSLVNDETWHTTTRTVFVPALSHPTRGPLGDDYTSLTMWISAGVDYAGRTNGLGTNDGFLEIAEVKLEVGTFSTIHSLDYASEELTKCQRYYQTGEFSYSSEDTIAAEFTNSVTLHPLMRDIPVVVLSPGTLEIGHGVSNTIANPSTSKFDWTYTGDATTTFTKTVDKMYTADAEL